MDLGLAGQVAVITGAAGGIGKTAALSFAGEGARVVVWDQDMQTVEQVAAEIKDHGGEAMGVAGSVASSADVARVVDQIRAHFGTVHVLINNAAINDDAPVTAMTDAQWDRVVDVNLKGPFYCARAIAPLMIAQNYGRIINISSRSHLGELNRANYVSAKAGLLGLTRSLAMELGPHQVTVNTIAPGMVSTERVRSNPNYADFLERAMARQHIKREAQPDDIVNAMLMLASATSGFITGDLIYVSGGRLT
ncbi:SDR family NAD(P)-dependent oxidoreductase [Phenylobacterium sp.]|jgi:3-oxoacyl-[acyl-carrier protein] reductase|uniref:SDR family NAD(P)-dependent oxidoreductase n=1 Tax=Phenylobacterium sp. TaxID=1871053 RepID=UPI002E32A673|nr:SDR family NAD(P)-dependent oxidoreductase [Phenylobacterium sp.]HEX3364628.1 SDR family NAD(P)-dependent oxidoreductase [Phenylobacterium sp.]